MNTTHPYLMTHWEPALHNSCTAWGSFRDLVKWNARRPQWISGCLSHFDDLLRHGTSRSPLGTQFCPPMCTKDQNKQVPITDHLVSPKVSPWPNTGNIWHWPAWKYILRGPKANTSNGWIQNTSEHNSLALQLAHSKGDLGKHHTLLWWNPLSRISCDTADCSIRLGATPSQATWRSTRLSERPRAIKTHLKETFLECPIKAIEETAPLTS